MFRLAIVAVVLLAVFGGGPLVLAEEAISEPRCVCGMSSGAEMLNPGRPIFSDLANASANEGDSGIDGQARPPRTLSRHHRGSSAVETGSTAYVAVTPVSAP
jgi:hypothetical protein